MYLRVYVVSHTLPKEKTLYLETCEKDTLAEHDRTYVNNTYSFVISNVKKQSLTVTYFSQIVLLLKMLCNSM